MDLNGDHRDRSGGDAPQRAEHRTERDRTALETAWRADSETCAHPPFKIESAGIMHEQPLEDVLASADVCAPQPTCLAEMRTRSLEQFCAFAEEPFPAVATNAPTIGVDRIAVCFFGIRWEINCDAESAAQESAARRSCSSRFVSPVAPESSASTCATDC
jgi:hypothetical protein